MYYKIPNLRGLRVIGPNGLDLNPGNRNNHEYPVDGWTWYDSPLEAADNGWEPPEEIAIVPDPDPDPVVQSYLDRAGRYAGPAQRTIARWAAYNHVQIADEAHPEWTQEAVAGLITTPKTQMILAALNTYGWGIAASILASATAADHPLATPQTVQAYLAAMAAEGVLPPSE